MQARGVRGIRINARQPGRVGLTCLPEYSRKIAAFGWHVQLAVSPDQLLAIAPSCRDLPCPVVFDHMAHLHASGGTRHAAFRQLVGLLQTAKAWVKLSGHYIGHAAAAPAYDDAVTLGAALARAAPERVLWGTDWPHPTVQGEKPDDAAWLDRSAVIAPGDAALHRILVDNPAELYGFSDEPESKQQNHNEGIDEHGTR
jgi:predicted TIM-barrel fold metal-dependent hydrolase